MAVSTADRHQQVQQAEELLFPGPELPSFAKELYFGRFAAPVLLPYPPAENNAETDELAGQVRRFLQMHVDPAQIDRHADIPRHVIDGLAQLGILGLTIPPEYGGRGISQYGNCRVMEAIGGHCGATAVFVNVHQAVGVRALLLFGTEEQKARWLPPLARGEQLAAFALTEPQAGSDAANVQTTAEPSADGRSYILNGKKQYITNGAIAGVLTVMARTRVRRSEISQVTAFLVTPDLPGLHITEARMQKCGIRGTVTSRLEFHDMPVPSDRVLGGVGNGLRVALSVLDFGRTAFGACCCGAANACVAATARHANARHQFGQSLGEFELVKKKIAWMAAFSYAMEATTYQTAALIDRAQSEYMLEAAMLKVFATEALWRIVNDTIQVFGGRAYFSREPYERMMRDARVNMIAEGANDVLLAFIALVGMRDVGATLQRVQHAAKHPLAGWPLLWRYASTRLKRLRQSPAVPGFDDRLRTDTRHLGRRLSRFAGAVEAVLRYYREDIIDRQYVQERIARAAIDLYTASCVLARLQLLLAGSSEATKMDSAGQVGTAVEQQLATGRYYLRAAQRDLDRQLAHLWDSGDAATTQLADRVLQMHCTK